MNPIADKLIGWALRGLDRLLNGSPVVKPPQPHKRHTVQSQPLPPDDDRTPRDNPTAKRPRPKP